ncbi:MAG TPA: hypothetical protein VG125_05840, partial [Pirellulales bacterium]|nr:hypothetical protein [Pirellulales bacterium]
MPIRISRLLGPVVVVAGCLSRLRGPLLVAAGIVAIFAAMHYVLCFTLGADAAAVHPRQRLLGFPLYEHIWQRVAAVDRLYHHGQLPPDTRLGVYLGVSTTATGIQRRFLDARATTADRWIVLSGAGLSFQNIESVMMPVFFCGLKPTTVVFGVHPQMLVGERYLGNEASVGPQHVVGRRQRAIESHSARLPALRWLRKLCAKHWAAQHRFIMGEFLRAQIYTGRLCVFYFCGVTAEYLSTPAAEPWDDDPLLLWNLDDVENQFAQMQIDFWTGRGHFERANYDPQGAQARALVRMIRAYRTLGAKVYLVIMPLRSTTRRVMPANAKPCLLEVIEKSFPDNPPTVIDFQDEIPDRYFADEAHLSKSGSDRLSKEVAEQLRATPA